LTLLKRKDFVHQNIRYSFNWNYKNHVEKINKNTTARNDFKKLETYFKKIVNESFVPNHIFNKRGIPRVSQFKIRGLKKAFILSYAKGLIRAGKIKKSNNSTKLPKLVQNVFNSYKENQIKNIPGHDPILKNILIKDGDSVAIEIPVWKTLKNSTITGHIDLIQIQEDAVKVIDYKPEGNFLYSIPQVATYGLLIKNIFKFKNLKCVTFNKDEVWEYNPEILLTDIKEYLISKQIKRPWEQYVDILLKD
jgi:hypothetical protein